MSATLPLAFAATLAATVLAAPSLAAAQEGPPGACACAAPIAPTAVAAPARSLPTWGLGLHLTSLSLAAQDTPEQQTDYSGGGLQLRYRVAPRWQLELSLDHVREQAEDGTDGDRQLQSVTFAALYHFRPHARWDWYLLAGVGATGDGNPDLSDEAREASQTAHVHLGAGVERRFRHVGIAAELRAVGIAPPEADGSDTPLPIGSDAAMTVPRADEPEGISGGQLTIAATYYF